MFFDLRAVPHMCAVLCHNGHPIDARIYVSTITMVFMGAWRRACLISRGLALAGNASPLNLSQNLSHTCQALAKRSFCIDNPQETIIIRVPT